METRINQQDNSVTKEPSPLNIQLSYACRLTRYTFAQIHEKIKSSESLGIFKGTLKKYLPYASYTYEGSPLSFKLLRTDLSIKEAAKYFKDDYYQSFQIESSIDIPFAKVQATIIKNNSYERAACELGVDILKLREYVSSFENLSQSLDNLINQDKQTARLPKGKREVEVIDLDSDNDSDSTHYSKKAKIDNSSSQINSSKTEVNVLSSENNVSESQTVQIQSDDALDPKEIEAFLNSSSLEFYNTQDPNLFFAATQNDSEQDLLERFEELNKFMSEQKIDFY